LGLIERALEEFKNRIREKSGAPEGVRARIDVTGLEKVLRSYGITASDDILEVITASSCGRSRRPSWATAAMSGHIETPSSNYEQLVTFDDLLTSTELWKLIAVSAS